MSTLEPHKYLWRTGLCAAAAIAAVSIYSSRSSPDLFVKTFSVSLAVGLAAFWLVGLIGFLFGVPPAKKKEDGESTANQSLEEVADWLTKLIIGAGLVELRAITKFIGDLGRDTANGLGLDSGPQLFSALIVANAACGFVFFYFWAYMYWDRLRKDASQRLQQLEELHLNEAITDAELAERRKAVLDGL